MSHRNRFKAKDKITHKMTRDGLVEVNASTGEENRISRREQDFNLQKGKAQQQEAPAHQPGRPDTARPRPSSPFKNAEPVKRVEPLPGAEHPAGTVSPSDTPAHVVRGIPDNRASDRTEESGLHPENQADTPLESPADASAHKQLHFDGEQAVPADTPEPQQGTAYYQRFSQDAARPPAGQPAPQTGGAPKPVRLQFTPEEQAAPDKKLAKAQQKADKTADRLEKARNRLPARKKSGKERIFYTKKNKHGHKIHFEAEAKSQQSQLKGTLPLRPAKAGANLSIGYAHNKLFQVEQENVGTEAAHKGELLAESGLRTAYRLRKTAPYRRVAKLERLSAKHNARLAYQKLLHQNPRLRTNLLSRFIQKQKIKRQYAKAARESMRAAQLMKNAGAAGGKILKIAAGFVSRHPMVIAMIALLILVIFSFSALFTSCANIAMGGLSSTLMSSYTAGDEDIDAAELAYTEWETDLQMRIQNAQAEHPGYDEYRYNVDGIGHNPFELTAYLSAKYQDFTFAAVKAELQRIFSQQYRLEFVAQTETRYRTETRTDPETGASYTVDVPYEWYILNVNLTSRAFADVVTPGLSADEQEMYDLYMQTKGNREYIASPFYFDWIPYVTCYYGWRIHPVTGEKDYHKGIDIGIPAGTDILAGQDGEVTQAAFDAGGYGYYIVIEGKDGLVSKYAHCDRLLASVGQQVKKGDVIAKSGNTGNSTGPHLHLEVLKNGQYLNPLFFAESPDSANERQ